MCKLENNTWLYNNWLFKRSINIVVLYLNIIDWILLWVLLWPCPLIWPQQGKIGFVVFRTDPSLHWEWKIGRWSYVVVCTTKEDIVLRVLLYGTEKVLSSRVKKYFTLWGDYRIPTVNNKILRNSFQYLGLKLFKNFQKI